MKDKINKFTIKKGICPEYIGSPLRYNPGCRCMLVLDENACVGVIWEHNENRYSKANGQAEIRFFERYRNSYCLWHRMFVNKRRLLYNSLQSELEKTDEYVYYCNLSRN